MSFDGLFRNDRPDQTLQRTAGRHCEFTMTHKLNMAFNAHQLAVAEPGRYSPYFLTVLGVWPRVFFDLQRHAATGYK
jgi:N-formylglutamate amidohydrolase